ncbi:MAG: hypothetical protein ACYSWP_04240 [Planctomycetota bacterium]|jgi:probable HAF family extracellular repeat protein
MKKNGLLFSMILLNSVIVNLTSAQIRYNAIDLGALPAYGYDMSLAYSINNNGQIVGCVLDDNHSTVHAVLFDTSGDGNNIDLGTLGGDNSVAHSINNNGRIVGQADSNSFYSPHATIFDSNGSTNTSLADESAAWSINDYNQIVGYKVFHPDNNDPVNHATIFNTGHDANIIDLGILPGYGSSIALSINNSGQIVGFSTSDMQSQDWRATLFDPNGSSNNIDLGTLGGQISMAFSINESGQIAGSADTADDYRRATLFDPNGDGNNIDLGTKTGYFESTAISINNNGQIVGAFYLDPIRGENRAMIFDPTGTGNNYDLNELINPALGYTLQGAIHINDNGHIVCHGNNAQGRGRAFLLTPADKGDFEPDRDIDPKDFAVFAAAWKTKKGDQKYNPYCDLAEPKDNIIDEKDLVVFVQNYLMETQ